jgi:hypothetical protein
VIHRLKSIIIIYYYYFLDAFLPLSRLTIPNPCWNFKFEGRSIIFEKASFGRSLVLKEGTSNGILEVFAFVK